GGGGPKGAGDEVAVHRDRSPGDSGGDDLRDHAPRHRGRGDERERHEHDGRRGDIAMRYTGAAASPASEREDEHRERYGPPLDGWKHEHGEGDADEHRGDAVHHVAPQWRRERSEVVAGRERSDRRQPDGQGDPRPAHDQAIDLDAELLRGPYGSRRHRSAGNAKTARNGRATRNSLTPRPRAA